MPAQCADALMTLALSSERQRVPVNSVQERDAVSGLACWLWPRSKQQRYDQRCGDREEQRLIRVTRCVTRYTLFVSLFNLFIGGAFIAFLFFLPTSIIASIASFLALTFILWIFWLASWVPPLPATCEYCHLADLPSSHRGASTADALGGAFSCSNDDFAHCNQLNALQAFAWINCGSCVHLS